MSKKNENREEMMNEEFKGKVIEEIEVPADSADQMKKMFTNALIAVLAVVVVVVAYLYWQSSEEVSTNEAAVAVSKFISKYNANDYNSILYGDTAVGGDKTTILDVVEEYSGTEQGKLAALYAANSFLELDKFEEAEKYFEIAIGSSSSIVQLGANAGLGVCLEKKSEYAKAADHYNTASSLTTFKGMKMRYMFYAALNYEKSGNNDKAIELYTEIVNTDKFSEFANLSNIGLNRLGTVIE